MVSRRNAAAYSKRKPAINTRRSKKQQKSYIKTIPPQNIVKFNMGDYKGNEAGKYKIRVTLSSGENIQIRDVALEAIRQSLNKDLTRLFQKQFFMKVNVYPHNILRNNRIFSGGSKGERVQTGMKHSFGSSEGRAAIIKKGKSIFTVYYNGEEHNPRVRLFFKKVTPKLACKAIVKLEYLKK
jgi:large subunit ribosomal protein L10e